LPEPIQQLVDPQGAVRDVPESQVAAALAAKWRAPTPEDTSRLSGEAAREQDYGGTAGAAKAASYALLRGASLGTSDVAFRALGAKPKDLRGYEERNPGLSTGAEFAGALIPSLLAPESLLGRAPAGAVSGIGRTIVHGAEGAGYGVAKKALAATTGAAIEGSLYGGGQYLSQVALENKPLAVEGFLASMGKGALWAAPIGGVLSLGEGALVRAKSLFPRSEVTRQAARAVDQEATAALSQSVRDGDTMLELARQEIARAEARGARAASGDRAARAMFGDAGPQAAADEIGAGLDKAKLTEAVEEYAASKTALEDWVRAEADPDLEAALLRVTAPDVQVGAPQLRVPGFGEVVPGQAHTPELGEFGLERTKVGRLAKGTGSSGTAPDLPALPIQEAPAGMPELPGSPDVIRAGRRSALADGTPPPRGMPDLPSAEPTSTPSVADEEGFANQLAAKNALHEYQNGKHIAINDFARTGKLAEGSPFTTAGEAEAYVAKLDEETASRTLDSDEVVYRGIGSGRRGPERGIRGDVKVGEVIEDPGFASVSRDPAVAHDYTNKPGSTMLEIEMPKGSRYAALPDDGLRESELLLPRNSKMRVLSVEQRNINGRDVRVARVRLESGEAGSGASHGLPDIPAEVPTVSRKSASPVSDLEAALRGTQQKLAAGEDLVAMSAPARSEYAAAKETKKTAAAEHFREAARAGQPWNEGIPRGRSGDYASSPMAAQEASMRGEALAQRAGIGGRGQRYAAAPQEARAIVNRAIGTGTGPALEEDAIQAALRKRVGKNVDIGHDLTVAAKVIGDHEAAAARLADALGADAPVTAQTSAKAYKAALAAQADAAAASAARAAGDISTKVAPAIAGDATQVDDGISAALRRHDAAQARGQARIQARDAAAAGRAVGALEREQVRGQAVATRASAKSAGRAVDSLIRDGGSAAVQAPDASRPRARGMLGIAADVGTALEVLHAMGVHTPDVSAIPVIGPVLSMYLKARAVLGVIGRRGGSVGRSTESLVASRAAAMQDRLLAAVHASFDVGAKTARRAAPIAGPGGALAHALFPGGEDVKSKDPRVLYQARADEIARAMAPGAIEHAVSDRIRTSDPALQDAITAQVERSVRFLDSKRPGQGVQQSMIPGDGKWHPSRDAIDEFARYVAAVHDPVGVLEDLAHGHPSKQGAEVLEAVYPEMFALAQRYLLEHAAEIRHTLPYARRASISLMYHVPVDLSMSPAHMQWLRPPEQAAPAGPQPGPQPGQPALTGPLQLGQQTMTSLERRAGA